MSAPASKPPSRWPHLRAALVLFHVAAVVVLSLPGQGVASRARFASANTKADFAEWAAALRRVGVDASAEQVEGSLWQLATGWARTRDALEAPFSPYARFAGVRQGWTMFASPQRHPVELHVDVFEDGAWRPLFRPRDERHSYLPGILEHNRVRKLLGRFARDYRRATFEGLAGWLAARIFADRPGASRVRVSLYAYDTLPPARVLAGEKPKGRVTERRELAREEAP